jgi:hypothetical protein
MKLNSEPDSEACRATVSRGRRRPGTQRAEARRTVIIMSLPESRASGSPLMSLRLPVLTRIIVPRPVPVPGRPKWHTVTARLGHRDRRRDCPAPPPPRANLNLPVGCRLGGGRGRGRAGRDWHAMPVPRAGPLSDRHGRRDSMISDRDPDSDARPRAGGSARLPRSMIFLPARRPGGRDSRLRSRQVSGWPRERGVFSSGGRKGGNFQIKKNPNNGELHRSFITKCAAAVEFEGNDRQIAGCNIGREASMAIARAGY